MKSYSIIKNMYLNSSKRIYELKDLRTVKQVLMMVMLLSREDKIRLMFWEQSVCEGYNSFFLSLMTNVNFEDKIFIRRVEM